RSRDVPVAVSTPPPQPGERQQPGELGGDARSLEQRFIESRQPSLASAWLAMGQVPSELTALPDPDFQQHAGLVRRNQRLDVLTAPAADQFVVLLAQPPAGT